MTLIDDIIRDREAGTPGRWEGRQVHGGMPADVCDYGVIGLDKGMETARVWNVDDARRIARVPDMEAALLAADKAIQELLTGLDFISDAAGGYIWYESAENDGGCLKKCNPAQGKEDLDRVNTALAAYREAVSHE